MRILLTGATGYIAKRLLPILVNQGHKVFACVRDGVRFKPEYPNVTPVQTDFLVPQTLKSIPIDIDVAFYLIHSMSSKVNDFQQLEATSAINFRDALACTNVKQVIYLSGIINDEKLSKHLSSRKNVEDILRTGSYHLTVLRAGIILGSGSASFEIMRDLVEKLPIMVAPRWLLTKSQPIAIRNVVEFLSGVMLRESTYNQSYDIGGPQVMTYKDMLLEFAKLRQMKRHILVVPVMTPRLSSYWLYFVTSTSYSLAVNLVNSMKVEVIAKPNNLASSLGIKLIPFSEAIRLAFERIESDNVLSSWKDSFSASGANTGILQKLSVPTLGCFIDSQVVKVKDIDTSLQRIWSIGGDNGWYYATWLWKVRGFIDQLLGGVGLRRGRTNPSIINAGDTLDFWRVLMADKQGKRLLLYAEMLLPGEAWLEFSIDSNGYLHQVATFRPKGLAGRAYWYLAYPLHLPIFRGMSRRLAR